LRTRPRSTTWSLTLVVIVMAVGGIVAGFFGSETRGEKPA
jgi:hypothetical protein